MKEIEDIGREGFGRLNFPHNTKLLIWGTKNFVFEKDFGGFWRVYIYFVSVNRVSSARNCGDYSLEGPRWEADSP